MSVCPLCSERPAKRYCPAKGERICAVCCGSKREVEIYCPADCTYLQAAHSYEDAKRPLDAEFAAKLNRFGPEFLYKFTPALNAVSFAVLAEHKQSPWLVDHDVVAVFSALIATMKTLSSGIYYESLPDGPVRQSLFQGLRMLLEEMMKPQESVERRSLKVSEAIEVLEFLQLTALGNSSERPKGRRYLDLLATMGPPPGLDDPSPSGGLILP